MGSPISWLVESGGWLYFAGTAPIDEYGKVTCPNDVMAQTETIIGRFRMALESEGLSLHNLVPPFVKKHVA